MHIDVKQHIGAVERSVSSPDRDGRAARAVTLSRIYQTDIQDLWDAITRLERLPRWFLPISGDLEPGGRYQFGGQRGRCDHCVRAPVTLRAHMGVRRVRQLG